MKFIHLTPAALVFVQLGALAVGMASWLDDDEEGSGDSAGDEEFGGDEEFDDDFDDEFGSFDDMDGGGGGAGAQDTSVNELEHRIEELETEVSNVASKANTVRSENEQISESVEDVEENVRKLLEIYEMVTRGVNPFVDDVNTDSMGGGGAESFGLFDDDDGGEDAAEEDLDADITDADADDFFEDDAFEEDDLDDSGMGEFDDDFDDGDEMDGFDEFEDDDEAENEEATDESETGGDGTSFEDLKEEYESGDADWAEDDDEPVTANAESAAPVESDDSDLGFDDSDLEADAEDDEENGGFEFEEEESSDDEPTSAAPAAPGLGFASDGDEPHLAEPPTGYLADVVALEWLDYLLSEFGPKNTVRTLNYYERIGWIGEPARDHLFDYLEGLTDSDYLYREEFGTTELTMDDHLESLDYIDELASENIERAIVDRFDDLHRNGIQR